MTKCTHCDATVLSTSQPAAASGWDDPADVWKAYCAETPTKRRSPQGALAFGFHAALVATPALMTSDPAPDPCGDLSIGELIEWLENPQLTNGFLNANAENHMAAAAMLIEKLIGVPALTATPADEEARDNLRLIDYIADKIGLPDTDELSRENFDAWFSAATPAVGGDDVETWRKMFTGHLRALGFGVSSSVFQNATLAFDLTLSSVAAQPVSPLRGRDSE